MPELSLEELERYARQIGPGVLSTTAQRRLKGSAALVTRAGGMGGPAALCLAMAGIGKLIVAHGGDLILPDLNRQLLGSEAALGQPRSQAFAAALTGMNRHVDVEFIDHEPDDDEAQALARRVDVVVACPPTFDERLRLNSAAVAAGVPLVDAAQWGMTGTLAVVQPGRTACLRCIYPRQPEFEELFPVVGAISAAMGSLAALEVIKYLTGTGRSLAGRMLLYDGFNGRATHVQLRRDPDCPVCRQARPREEATLAD
ncbi:MAG: HesA/MoeB/ThiF family protein [Pirellulales bacterium]|nr:HesA/MoeB/ThiF family protein [Pirellulales bacterium]